MGIAVMNRHRESASTRDERGGPAGRPRPGRRRGNPGGFTMLELLVALTLSLIGLAAVYVAYQSQQKSYLAQEAVAAMQQNLRSAMYFLERDIRMAGCNPSGFAPAAIVPGGSTSVRFTMDVTGGEADGRDNDHDGLVDEPDEFYDGDCSDAGEDVRYALGDADGNGVTDLLRNNVPVAQNIEAMDLVYLREDGGVAVLPWRIRYIEVTLVARSGKQEQGFTDTTSYSNQQGTVIRAAPNDHYRRRSLTVQVKCRNVGS